VSDSGNVGKDAATPAVGGSEGNSTLSSRPESEPNDGLVFRWRAKRGHAFALTFFTGVAVLVHATGFYLFQVVPPLSGRIEAQPAKVTILNSDDPTTAAMLREIDDRLVFLRPASLGTSSRLKIEEFAVTFSPSFMRHRVPFRQPGASEQVQPLLAELQPRDGLVLPPVKATDFTVIRNAAPERLTRWRLAGDLAERPLNQNVAEKLGTSLPILESGPGVIYQIWVDASGKVVNIMTLSGMDQPLQADVAALIRAQLRFEPNPENPLQSGEFHLER